VRSRDRSKDEDDDEEAGPGGERVLEEFEPHVAGGELLRGDTRSNDDHGEHRAPEIFGEETTP
jgi:hypothetical protein